MGVEIVCGWMLENIEEDIEEVVVEFVGSVKVVLALKLPDTEDMIGDRREHWEDTSCYYYYYSRLGKHSDRHKVMGGLGLVFVQDNYSGRCR